MSKDLEQRVEVLENQTDKIKKSACINTWVLIGTNIILALHFLLR